MIPSGMLSIMASGSEPTCFVLQDLDFVIHFHCWYYHVLYSFHTRDMEVFRTVATVCLALQSFRRRTVGERRGSDVSDCQIVLWGDPHCEGGQEEGNGGSEVTVQWGGRGGGGGCWWHVGHPLQVLSSGIAKCVNFCEIASWFSCRSDSTIRILPVHCHVHKEARESSQQAHLSPATHCDAPDGLFGFLYCGWSLRSPGIMKGVCGICMWTCGPRPTPCLCAVTRHIHNNSLFSWNEACPQKHEILHHFAAIQYIDVHRNVVTFRSVSVLISFASIHCMLGSTTDLWCIRSFEYIMCTSVLYYSLPIQIPCCCILLLCQTLCELLVAGDHE